MRTFFSRMNPTLRGFLIILAIVGVIVVLQLQATLSALLIIARIAFMLAIAFFIYLIWRERREEISAWSRGRASSSTGLRCSPSPTSAPTGTAARTVSRSSRSSACWRPLRARHVANLAGPAHLSARASARADAPSSAVEASRTVTAGRRRSACRARCIADASLSRSVSIRCMKSAGSSHSNAVMNSWSSIPNEYVVWLWIVELLRRHACARPSRAAGRPPGGHTTGAPSRTDRRRGTAIPSARSSAAARIRVLRRLRRREIRVRRLEPAGERRPVQRGAELAERPRSAP